MSNSTRVHSKLKKKSSYGSGRNFYQGWIEFYVSVVIKLLVNHSTANNVLYNQLWHFNVQLYRAVKVELFSWFESLGVAQQCGGGRVTDADVSPVWQLEYQALRAGQHRGGAIRNPHQPPPSPTQATHRPVDTGLNKCLLHTTNNISQLYPSHSVSQRPRRQCHPYRWLYFSCNLTCLLLKFNNC